MTYRVHVSFQSSVLVEASSPTAARAAVETGEYDEALGENLARTPIFVSVTREVPVRMSSRQRKMKS